MTVAGNSFSEKPIHPSKKNFGLKKKGQYIGYPAAMNAVPSFSFGKNRPPFRSPPGVPLLEETPETLT
jgi:hypothetical protein